MARALLKSRFCEIEGGLSEKLFESRRRRDEFFSRRRRFQAKSLDFNRLAAIGALEIKK
jgi:hypothetical protein